MNMGIKCSKPLTSELRGFLFKIFYYISNMKFIKVLFSLMLIGMITSTVFAKDSEPVQKPSIEFSDNIDIGDAVSVDFENTQSMSYKSFTFYPEPINMATTFTKQNEPISDKRIDRHLLSDNYNYNKHLNDFETNDLIYPIFKVGWQNIA